MLGANIFGLLITFIVLFKNSSKIKLLIKEEPLGLKKSLYLGYTTHMQEMTVFIFTLQTTRVQVLEIEIRNK